MSENLCLAEASCASQIRTAKAVAEEIGSSAAARSGVSKWANISDGHSERDVQHVVAQQGSRLDVPISEMSACGVKIPWIRPVDWIQYVVDMGLTTMFAGVSPEQKHLAPQIWTEFWKKYQTLNPDFELFHMDNIDYSRTFAFFCHGDEGRTLKKNGLMVTQLQSALGKGFDNKRLKRDAAGSLKPQVNFAGHTFANRFVSWVMPKTVYEKKPQIFEAAMNLFAQNLHDLQVRGIRDPFTGETFRIVILGCKGDWPYLQKAGNLNRCYNTAAKRGDSKKVHGICHLCMAGLPQFPAEQLDTTQPEWLKSVGVQLPWKTTPALVKHLIHDRSNPATFFSPDLWHTVHLGFGRSWISSVVNFALDVIPRSNLDLKWQYLTDHYFKWCRDNQAQSHVSKITPYLMSYDDKTGKQGRWHKGALTTNFCKWLLRLLKDLPEDAGGLLAICRAGTAKLNAMFTCFFQGGFFLDQAECLYSSSCGQEFLATYYFMAQKMFDIGQPSLFPLYPKLHSMHHMMIRLHSEGLEIGFSQNPMSCSCQLDEDVIGRVSRLSRRVSIRSVMCRTLERYLIGCCSVWKDCGLIR